MAYFWWRSYSFSYPFHFAGFKTGKNKSYFLLGIWTIFGLIPPHFRIVFGTFRIVFGSFRTVSDCFPTVFGRCLCSWKKKFSWPGLGHHCGRPPFRSIGADCRYQTGPSPSQSKIEIWSKNSIEKTKNEKQKDQTNQIFFSHLFSQNL